MHHWPVDSQGPSGGVTRPDTQRHPERAGCFLGPHSPQTGTCLPPPGPGQGGGGGPGEHGSPVLAPGEPE